MIIYKITNILNGKIYVGQDSNNDPEYYGSGKIIKNAIKKYGKENFIKETIEFCETKEKLNEREIYWISEINSIVPNGYNITSGGTGGNIWQFLSDKQKEERNEKWKKTVDERYSGVTWECHTEEGNKKISETKKGKKCTNRKRIKLSQEHKDNISKSMKGKKMSDETKQKLRNINTGKEMSENIKEKISKSLKNNKNAKGYKHTEEAKKKISESKKGGKSNKGYKWTEEQKKRMVEKRLERNKLKKQKEQEKNNI